MDPMNSPVLSILSILYFVCSGIAWKVSWERTMSSCPLHSHTECENVALVCAIMAALAGPIYVCFAVGTHIARFLI